MLSYELRATSYELRATSYELAGVGNSPCRSGFSRECFRAGILLTLERHPELVSGSNPLSTLDS